MEFSKTCDSFLRGDIVSDAAHDFKCDLRLNFFLLRIIKVKELIFMYDLLKPII